MKIGNTEINTEKVGFILNLISFIAGMLFYIRMGSFMEHKIASAPVNNALRDSVLVIETKLNFQLKELRMQQDSIMDAIKINQQKLSTQNTAIKTVRQQIHITVNSDWDKLNPQAQDKYTDELLLNLKTKKPPS